MQRVLSGQFYTWKLMGKSRRFVDVVLPYDEARCFFQPSKFNAITGKGEQRDLNEPHVRRLKKEIEEGNFTPVPIAVGLRKEHLSSLKLEGNDYELTIDDKKPLSETDGNHRMAAIAAIIAELEEAFSEAEKAEDQEEMDRLDEINTELLSLPIGARIYFDGNPQTDFVNLQQGRQVDKAHLLSLQLHTKKIDDPERKLAFDIVKYLASKPGSPFKNLVRFDSRGVAPLPHTTLCSKSASDLGTSVVGLAKIGLDYGLNDAAVLGDFVLAAFQTLEQDTSLIDSGKVLCPIGSGGTKGTATMLIGVANCLAFNCLALGCNKAEEDDCEQLLDAARSTLDVQVSGNLSGPRKRSLIGQFARSFLAGIEDLGYHDGLPIPLLRAVSCSGFDAEPLPKEPKTPKVRKPKGEPTTSPAPVTEPVTILPVAPPQSESADDSETETDKEPWDGNEDDAPWDKVA